MVDLTKDHPVTRTSLGLDPSRHFRKAAAGAVPFSCSAQLFSFKCADGPTTTHHIYNWHNGQSCAVGWYVIVQLSEKWWMETQCRLWDWKSKHELYKHWNTSTTTGHLMFESKKVVFTSMMKGRKLGCFILHIMLFEERKIAYMCQHICSQTKLDTNTIILFIYFAAF